MRILSDFQGHEVRLSDERWRHIVEHPEMAGMGAALEETLRSPELVIGSRSDPATAFTTGTICTRWWAENGFVLW